MVRPVSSAANSASPPAWRRTARGEYTSVRVIERPKTCAARPARTVSTSGSSGTRRFLWVGDQKCSVGLFGGILLGDLLRGALPGAPHRGAQDQLCGEDSFVVGTGALDLILRGAQSHAGGEFLDRSLPVQCRAQPGGLLEVLPHHAVDDLPGRFQTMAQIDGPEYRLESIGEYGVLVPAPGGPLPLAPQQSEEHTSELQSRGHPVCRLLLEKNN